MATRLLLGTASAVVIMLLSSIGATFATTLYTEPKAKDPKVDIVQDPAAVPAAEAPGKRPPKTHDVVLTTTEVEAKLEDGTTYTYWTFNNKVPGPMLRVRVGDTVNVKMTNAPESSMNHSVDFHAATGFLGGGSITQAEPGQTKKFSFKARAPGVYVYHCATPMVAHHIAKGMFGLIVVEPEDGLPKADKEFYVMQQEIYAAKEKNIPNSEDDYDGLANEYPGYFVFNGAVGALVEDKTAQGEGGRDGPHLVRCGRPELHLVLPCDR